MLRINYITSSNGAKKPISFKSLMTSFFYRLYIIDMWLLIPKEKKLGKKVIKNSGFSQLFKKIKYLWLIQVSVGVLV